MSATWKSVAKAVVPPAWRRWARRLVSGAVYTGDYASWAEAAAVSQGYDAAVILERALAATRAVRDGQAAWERDTVLFHTPECNAPVLHQLRRAAELAGGRLALVDFGGAFGSTWWQHRSWLADLVEVRWSVVEQPAWVAAGQREFAGGPLRFYGTLAECCAVEKPDVILLSSVLPYLEAPHRLMAGIASGAFRHVIVDRTGFVAHGRDRLTVQRVPASIYPASYPCWFFEREKLLQPLARDWRVVAEWPAEGHVDIAAEYRGLALEREGR
jgi:putative methyltransferase (TIGR04325 family)